METNLAPVANGKAEILVCLKRHKAKNHATLLEEVRSLVDAAASDLPTLMLKAPFDERPVAACEPTYLAAVLFGVGSIVRGIPLKKGL